MKYVYRKTEKSFEKLTSYQFTFEKGKYQKDSSNRLKHDFSNVLVSASLNQRSDDKNSAIWRIRVFSDSEPIEETSFENTLNELVNLILNYERSNNYYGIVSYVIQRTSLGYEIFDVSFR